MNNISNEKGITLISLVVTIVVLTIIATITISVSSLNNGLIDETKTSTKNSQINKYIELIELTRQEALSREYVLELNAKNSEDTEKENSEDTENLVLSEMLRIMTNADYADEWYKNAKSINRITKESKTYIEFITAEGYKFLINEEKTVQELN